MEIALVILEVEITSEGFTLLKYRDKSGHMHTNFDNLSLERVIEIFTQGKRLENVLLLSEGSGRRLVRLEVAMDNFLKEKFGFNKVGEIVRP